MFRGHENPFSGSTELKSDSQKETPSRVPPPRLLHHAGESLRVPQPCRVWLFLEKGPYATGLARRWRGAGIGSAGVGRMENYRSHFRIPDLFGTDSSPGSEFRESPVHPAKSTASAAVHSGRRARRSGQHTTAPP